MEKGGLLPANFAISDVSAALERNIELQSALRLQLRRIDASHANVRAAIHRTRTLESRLPPQPSFPTKPFIAYGSQSLKKALVGSPSFIDHRGKVQQKTLKSNCIQKPPVHPDFERYKKQRQILPLVYKRKNWSSDEVDNLKRGVRQQNLQLRANALLEQFKQRKDAGEDVYLEDLHKNVSHLDELPDSELLNNTDGVDWNQIQSAFVPSRSSHECRTRWLQTDDPRINYSSWTRAEDKLLLGLVAIFKERDWEEIARRLGTNRTPAMVFKRYQLSLNTHILNNVWTKLEDRKLMKAVRVCGTADWSVIADHLDGRTGQMCLHRYNQVLAADLKKGRWTEEEDVRLLLAIHAAGDGNWREASKHIPTRTGSQVRERYENVFRTENRKDKWSEVEDSRLRLAVAITGQGKWSHAASIVGLRTDNQVWRRFKNLYKASGLNEFRMSTVIKRSAMPSSFVGRGKHKPDLRPSDFDVVDELDSFYLPSRPSEEHDPNHSLRRRVRRTDVVPAPTTVPSGASLDEWQDGVRRTAALCDALNVRSMVGHSRCPHDYQVTTPPHLTPTLLPHSNSMVQCIGQSMDHTDVRKLHDDIYVMTGQPDDAYMSTVIRGDTVEETAQLNICAEFLRSVMHNGAMFLLRESKFVPESKIVRKRVRRKPKLIEDEDDEDYMAPTTRPRKSVRYSFRE